ncbi:MAG: hypothetical protein A2X86_15535 [Bdellovibrionales bacterium GWA2_49_15]|nr:MAG: hypothetical protein A2X86_15535 [Bdellovibrionales bacterium GWA2_49_15]HAZ14542.1 hypothetical protein [Bdellovibrionales bacterium]
MFLFRSIVVMLFITACNNSPTYDHPSKSSSIFSTDSKQCEAESMNKYPGEEGFVGDAKRANFVKACLEEKGWVRQDKKISMGR